MILGFSAEISTMVLPKRHFLAASVLFTSTIRANSRRHNIPRVFHENLVCVFRCYMWPPLMVVSTKAPNSIWVVSVTTKTEQWHHDHHHQDRPQPTNVTFTTSGLPHDAWCHVHSPAIPPHATTIHHGLTFPAVPHYNNTPLLNLPCHLQPSYSDLP